MEEKRPVPPPRRGLFAHDGLSGCAKARRAQGQERLKVCPTNGQGGTSDRTMSGWRDENWDACRATSQGGGAHEAIGDADSSYRGRQNESNVSERAGSKMERSC
jgi:hypothetical protein